MKYCEDYAALLDPYIDGELSPEDTARVREHLTVCGGCRAYVQAALLLLDGVMWFLLHSEDSALLLGTGVLVLALSSLMFLTRRVDWYALSLPKGSVPPPPSADDDKLRLWKE